MFYHIIAFAAGFLLDCLIGDPYTIPHPIRWIGTLIGALDRRLLGKPEEGKRSAAKETGLGLVLVLLVLCTTVFCTSVLLHLAYRLHPAAGVAVEAALTCYIFAAKSLQDESMKVYTALQTGTLQDARNAVAMIVGRDTQVLDEAGVIRAAVETVAENTSDGVIAPMLYTCLGGPVLGLAYKAINTMDSMVGYHNERYEHFGTCAAKLDDVVNFIPARISALLMIAAARFAGRDYNAREAWRIFRRDRYKHKSPNSAQTESTCAGALGVQLAGDASYFGKTVHKPTIGDDSRPIQRRDIARANLLMRLSSVLALVLCLADMLLCAVL